MCLRSAYSDVAFWVFFDHIGSERCSALLQRWLNEMDIVWYESKGNLNWGEILKTIREDTAGFAEDGGFDIFLGDDHPSGRKRGKKNDRDGNGADEDDDEEDDDEDDEVGKAKKRATPSPLSLEKKRPAELLFF